MPRRTRSALAPFVLLLGAALPLLAGEPYLVKDLNPIFFPASSTPYLFGTAGSRVVFYASTKGSGIYPEPWGSDGTPGGTERLLDGCPEACRTLLNDYGQTDRRVFFRNSTDGTHHDLWATDGTHAGTFQVTLPPVEPLYGSLGHAGFVSTPTQLYFLADDSVHGIELWRSDGTPHGTFLITDLRPGPAGAAIADLVVLGERAIFVADDGRGKSLWVSDGTAAGTRLLLDPSPGSAIQEAPAHLRQVGPYVYFTANVGKSGTELWRTDGTTAGTVQVADLAPGSKSLQYVAGGRLGDRLLFVAAVPGKGREVWISNGTKAGTYAVTSFAADDPFGPAASAPDYFAHLDLSNRALFLADDGVHGQELWVTDGSRTGTRLLRDLCTGACSSSPSLYSARLGGLGFFAADDGAHGRELWATDGTAAGTRMVGDLCPGSCSSSIAYVGAVAGKLAFLLFKGLISMDLWSWSPTAPAATRVAAFGPLDSGNAGFLAEVVGRRLYFSGRTPELGNELWRSNLTPAGTVQVQDLTPSRTGQGSNLRTLIKQGSQALLFAESSVPNELLWKTDGTEAGTELLFPAGGGPIDGASTISARIELGSLALFEAYHLGRGQDVLWRSDGTSSGTFPLTPPEASLVAPQPVAVGPRAFFTASTHDSGSELWTTDGTVAGTRQVVDLRPGPDSSGPNGLIAVGGKVLFHATRSQSDGDELWVSDGTAAGTTMVKDLTPAADASTGPRHFLAHGTNVVFSTQGALDRRVVWKTDGTAAGTVPAVDGSALPGVTALTPVASTGTKLFLQASTGGPSTNGALYVSDGDSGTAQALLTFSDTFDPDWTVVGNRLYFLTGSGFLWVSDGTAAGTQPVRDAQGTAIADSGDLRSVGGKLVYSHLAHDGVEIWITDGTPAGTRRLVAGKTFDFPVLGEVGGKILFREFRLETGIELWAVEP